MNQQKHNQPPFSVLAFDFGSKRIGIAYGNSTLQSGSPVIEINAKDGIPNWDDIKRVIDEYKPDCCLTGLPLNMDGSDSEMSLRARKFARRLHGRFGLPSWVWDERLSSHEAKQFRPSDNYKANAVDALAASLILESWFDNNCPEQTA